MAEFKVIFELTPAQHATTVELILHGIMALERMRDDMLDKLEIDFDNVDEEAVETIELVNTDIAIAKVVVNKLTTIDNE